MSKQFTYHWNIVTVAILANASPVAFMTTCDRALAAVSLVAVLAILAIAPSIQLQGYFVIVTVAIA